MTTVGVLRSLKKIPQSLFAADILRNHLSPFSFFVQVDIDRMAGSNTQKIKARSEQTDKILAELKNQVEAIKKAALREAGRAEEVKLEKENEKIKREIQALKQALTLAEIGNGVRQVLLPTQGALAACAASASATASAPSSAPAAKAKSPPTEKSNKNAKPDAEVKKRQAKS